VFPRAFFIAFVHNCLFAGLQVVICFLDLAANYAIPNSIELNGIDLNARWTISRDALLSKIEARLLLTKRILLKAPPATGKTALLHLFAAKFSGKYEVQMDTARENLPGPLPSFADARRGLFILDDAHYVYRDEQYLDALKQANYFVIIAGTREFNDNATSPVFFDVLSYQDIKFNEPESSRLYDALVISSPLALVPAKDEGVKNAVLEQCGGHPGALISTLVQFQCHHEIRPQSAADLIQLLFSRTFISQYSRIWATSFAFSFSSTDRQVFMKLLCGIRIEGYKELLSQLERGFIIEDQGSTRAPQLRFLFPLTRRRILFDLFGDHAQQDKFGSEWTIDDLILQAVQSFEPMLLASHVPKETAIQHMLLRGLVSCMAFQREVVPEISARLSNTATTKGKGELDFYINGPLKWGIELVSDGANIPEHLQRFQHGGKCFTPNILDYRVVDFRSDSSKKRKTDELDEFEVQVRFSQSYTNATLSFGKSKQQVTVDIGGPTKKLTV
jgi:hypothetical protein